MARRKSKASAPPPDLDETEGESNTAAADAEVRAAKRADNIYSGKYETQLAETYNLIVGAFEDKLEQDIAIKRYWKCYNCQLTPNQAYQGNSSVYLPIVHDAIEARVQRFVNTLFPENGRYTDVLANVPNNIHAIMGLLDHYVKRAHLKTKAKEMLRNGEVEGQISIYVEWQETTRYVTKKIMKHPELEPGVYDPTDTFADVEDSEITDARPDIHLIGAQDLAVLPPTWDDIETDAEIVAVRRWYTKAAIEKAIRDGLFDREEAQKLLTAMDSRGGASNQDPREEKLHNAGVQWKSGCAIAMIYEAWQRIEVDKKFRWCKIYYAGPTSVLGMFVNPNWNDRCSVITKALTKVDGSGWGKSKIDAVEQLQYMANDWANMAGDNGMYSLLPIVMTDPEKNPNLASMVMNLAAVWQTSPNDTKFVEFPQLWKDALQFVSHCESRVLQSFGLNPAMMPSGTTSKKQTQADVAQDQAVALSTITDEVSTLEDDIFTPALQFFFELDQQHRDDDLAIKIYGQMGISAKMQAVPPFAWDDRYEISWRGSQVFRSMQQTQQMIAGLNILKSLPPVLPNGSRIEISPIIETLVENLYGPRLGARVLVDIRDQMTVPPELENQLMAGGVMALVHQQDNDVEHLQSHLQDMQRTGDPTGLVRAHIEMTQEAMAKKQQAMQPQGLPGAPGGGGQPGVAGTPRPGAQPTMPRGGQNPAGAIHSDRMQDPGRMPRRAG